MRPDLRDKLIDRIEEKMRWAGAKSFDEGTQDLLRFLEAFREKLLPMKTKAELAALLDQMPDPSWLEQRLMFGTLKYLPQMLRAWARQLASEVEQQIPGAPAGRPATDLQTKVAIVTYVGSLHIQGYEMEISKRRAAGKFGVSESTVQRAWDDRRSIDEADFRSSLKWISEQQ